MHESDYLPTCKSETICPAPATRSGKWCSHPWWPRPHLAGIAAVARGVQIKPRSLIAQQVGIIVVCRFYELPHRVLVNSLIAPAQPSPFSRFGVVDHLAIAIRRTSGYEEIKLSLRNARHALAIFRHGSLQLLHGL